MFNEKRKNWKNNLDVDQEKLIELQILNSALKAVNNSLKITPVRDPLYDILMAKKREIIAKIITL